MSYQTYTTKALVCGTFTRNTSDGSYLLFTREAGMLYADARSVREEKSKQRYALQDFSLINVSLVKGKHGWKIGSVEPQLNYYHEAYNKSARGSIVGVFRILRRFLSGEEAMMYLFDLTTDCLSSLRSDIPNRNYAEEVAALLIVAELGYVDKKQIPLEVTGSNLAVVTRIDNKGLVMRVNQLYKQAVAVSHL